MCRGVDFLYGVSTTATILPYSLPMVKSCIRPMLLPEIEVQFQAQKLIPTIHKTPHLGHHVFSRAVSVNRQLDQLLDNSSPQYSQPLSSWQCPDFLLFQSCKSFPSAIGCSTFCFLFQYVTICMYLFPRISCHTLSAYPSGTSDGPPGKRHGA